MQSHFSKIILVGFAVGLGACSSSDTAPPVTNPYSTTAQICTPSAQVSCNSLAGLWASGNAICKDDGLSYDVSACIRSGDSSKNVAETVYPAQRDSRWKNAKCNHAGDFVFTITYPPHPSGVWIIDLEGGGFCAFDGLPGVGDDGSCSTRDRFLVEPVNADGSSFPKDRSVTNAITTNDPDFGNAINVVANYCSSDFWTGTNTTGIPIHWQEDGSYQNWPFTGHINFDSMMDILKERYGLDDNSVNLSIYFHGLSAGGWGVINNSWDMYQRFPKTADRGNLMLSSSAGFVAENWNDPNYPVFGIIDPILGPLTAQDAFGIAIGVWGSKLYDQCVSKNPTIPQLCLSGDTMYPFITGSKGSGGMDLSMLVYQNRQDQLYLGLLEIPPMSSQISTEDLNARNSFIDIENTAMGIDPLIPNASSRIRWLFAPSDPQIMDGNGLEPNVHPPLCYMYDSPAGPDQSLDALTRRFWHTRGAGPGRGQATGEVITFTDNFVTLATGDCQ